MNNRLIVLFLALITFDKAHAQALQGQVEDSKITPTTLNGNTDLNKAQTDFIKPDLQSIKPQVAKPNNNYLKGDANRNESGLSSGMGQPEKGMPSNIDGTPVLNGSANYNNAEAQSDPDAGDRELEIKWDLWRNRFLWAVQSNMMKQSSNPSETMMHWDPTLQRVVSGFPVGICAWFACEVTDTGQIINLKILHSSGIQYYDNAVLRAVYSLQGTPLLRFPDRSRRKMVAISAGIKSVSHAQPRKYYHFGDVEQYDVPEQ